MGRLPEPGKSQSGPVPVREPRSTGSAESAEHLRARAAGQEGREPDEKAMVVRIVGPEPDTEAERREPDVRFR